MSDQFSKKIEKKTGVDMNSIKGIADSFKETDLSDEKAVRRLIKKVSKTAGKPVNKSTEDMLVKMISKNKGMLNESTISKMINKK
ncbi:stage VI sporulation protein F [Radiobacillus kanasensis]|uniref:stage VI sporulation protein F n=1 Tax=Radiobacillus kanasensis TaxID=2844358 RepID=UPI001E508C7F|nr:stage VI sporulation protein F [Radiobacillus kanasensis]UFT99028.1 stage VI sporulation protein F [Radiobacillus kanasensis]